MVLLGIDPRDSRLRGEIAITPVGSMKSDKIINYCTSKSLNNNRAPIGPIFPIYFYYLFIPIF